ncbi:MAG: hypothetical protein QW103_01950 [Candidatus Pacearchaeota archaeon]
MFFKKINEFAMENIERVIINEELVLTFNKIINSQYEHFGFFVTNDLKEEVIRISFNYEICSENDTELTSPRKKTFFNKFGKWIAFCSGNNNFSFVYFHTHSRPFGDIIKRFDPYWSINSAENLKIGEIVDGRFFVSLSENSSDEKAFKFYSEIAALLGVRNFYHLFIRPEY